MFRSKKGDSTTTHLLVTDKENMPTAGEGPASPPPSGRPAPRVSTTMPPLALPPEVNTEALHWTCKFHARPCQVLEESKTSAGEQSPQLLGIELLRARVKPNATQATQAAQQGKLGGVLGERTTLEGVPYTEESPPGKKARIG